MMKSFLRLFPSVKDLEQQIKSDEQLRASMIRYISQLEGLKDNQQEHIDVLQERIDALEKERDELDAHLNGRKRQ